MSITTTYRAWEPGDGLRCTESNKAPREVPCGQPVITAVRVVTSAIGRHDYAITKPLCANHAPGGLLPSKLTVAAKKIATERLCAENWAVYRDYYLEAITTLRAQHDNSAAVK